MKNIVSIVAVLFLATSCHKNADHPIEKTQFNFSRFTIKKGQVGPIKIGMTIADAEKQIPQLSKKVTNAWDYGFDGGGKAYLYSLNNEPVLALVPAFNSQKIISIIALSEQLKTNSGISPKTTVAEILKKYPNAVIYQSAMMNWEYIDIENNHWYFVFQTDENHLIGKYQENNVPSQPIRKDIKMDWIEVK
jgi:hypothetical protein